MEVLAALFKYKVLKDFFFKESRLRRFFFLKGRFFFDGVAFGGSSGAPSKT
jgi:hypothetical protein